jgi:hypothetical protein
VRVNVIPCLVLNLNYRLATECVSDHGQALCKEIGGICVQETDGYYMVNAICLTFGIIFLVAFIIPTARKLQSTCSFGNGYTISLTVIIRTSDTGMASEDAVDSRRQQRSLDSFADVCSSQADPKDYLPTVCEIFCWDDWRRDTLLPHFSGNIIF